MNAVEEADEFIPRPRSSSEYLPRNRPRQAGGNSWH